MATLQSIPEFRNSEAFISKLHEKGYEKIFEKNEPLLKENSPIHAIPIILEGAVRVYQLDDDYKEMLLYYLKEGEMCIMSFLGGLYNEESKIKAVAHEKSRVLLIPVHQLGELLKEYPEWMDYVLRVYHLRFNELLNVLNAVAFKKMDERLLAFIQKRAEVTGSSTLKITHEELSQELGTARVVVSRLLKELEKQGVVRLGRNQITLL